MLGVLGCLVRLVVFVMRCCVRGYCVCVLLSFGCVCYRRELVYEF